MNTTIKVIRLIINQTLANYRKPMNYQIKQSYPLPPYSTIIGMVHKACGFAEYHPMDISIQGITNGSIDDIYTKYTFSKGAKYESSRHQLKIKGDKKDYGITKGVGNIELIEDIQLIIHIRPQNEDEINFIYEKLKYPNTYLSLGRQEDLIDIRNITIEECKVEEEADVLTTTYVPINYDTEIKGSIYILPKEFYINPKTNLRQFKKPISVCLVEKGEILYSVYVDKDKYPVVLA